MQGKNDHNINNFNYITDKLATRQFYLAIVYILSRFINSFFFKKKVDRTVLYAILFKFLSSPR